MTRCAVETERIGNDPDVQDRALERVESMIEQSEERLFVVSAVGKRTVLIVEDNDLVAKALRRIVSEYGLDPVVTSATVAEVALTRRPAGAIFDGDAAKLLPVAAANGVNAVAYSGSIEEGPAAIQKPGLLRLRAWLTARAKEADLR